MPLMRSKLTLVVLSAILVGGAAAMLAGMSAIRPPSFSPALAANNSTGATNTTGSAATGTTAGHSGGATSTTGPSATATNTSVPTPRPTRTPTPIPIPGQTLTVRGDVGSINTGAGTFVVNVSGGGGSYTIVVSSSTVWSSPTVKSFSALQVGMRADVVGIYQSGGNLNPTNNVDAYIDN